MMSGLRRCHGAVHLQSWPRNKGAETSGEPWTPTSFGTTRADDVVDDDDEINDDSYVIICVL